MGEITTRPVGLITSAISETNPIITSIKFIYQSSDPDVCAEFRTKITMPESQMLLIDPNSGEVVDFIPEPEPEEPEPDETDNTDTTEDPIDNDTNNDSNTTDET